MKRALHLFVVLAIAVAVQAAPKPKSKAAAVPKLPKPDHIVIVIEENKSPRDLTVTSAPYLNNVLVPMGASLGKMYAFHHPSQPNYFEFFAGTNQLDVVTVCGDSCLPSQSKTNNLYDAIASTPGVTFTGFAEDLPPNMTNAQIVAKCPQCNGQSCFPCNFALRHAPWISFAAVPDSATQPFSAFPTDFSKLPTISIVIPNLLNDMHWPSSPTNCPDFHNDIPTEVKQGDTWLKKNLDAYAQWAMTNNSLLIVTWDEDDYEGDPQIDCAAGEKYSWPKNQIATYIVGQPVKKGYTSKIVYNHHDLLNTILQMYGMPAVGASAGAKVIADIWK